MVIMNFIPRPLIRESAGLDLFAALLSPTARDAQGGKDTPPATMPVIVRRLEAKAARRLSRRQNH